MASELDQAYSHCQRVAKEHAKNFYYAFRTLPSRKRRAIYATYAFCRFCDDIADGEGGNDHKDRQFAVTRERLMATKEGKADGPVFTALHDATRTFDIPYEYLEEVIEGVEMDLTQTRFADFDALYRYCYKVASVVGLICIEVFGYDDPAAKDHAVDLGVAMQLTNILRDIREDAERGRVYLPQDELDTFGYSEVDLMAGVVNDQFKDLMAFQVERARTYFGRGKQLFPHISAESRACPAVLHAVYSGVLDRIEASGYDVFSRRIGLATRDKVMLTAKLWAGSLIPRVPVPSFLR